MPLRRACRALLPAMLLAGAITACGGRPYVYESLESADFLARAEIQTDRQVRVSAVVPSAAEAAAIFGVDLYRQGVQPVWLQIENGSGSRLRYAPVGTDRFYFSPLEVAWKHRGGFSKEGKLQMQQRFHGLALERYIAAGESESGFVFTHLRRGAKDFNVDLFSPAGVYYFTFLLRVPGFVPDYAKVDFGSIYAPEELTVHDESSLRAALSGLPCCSGNASGDASGNPVNVVLVGLGKDLLYSLLRANWRESSADDEFVGGNSYLFGRPQDAVFRYGSSINDGHYELRLWLAPMRIEEKLVWLGQVRYVIDHRWTVARPDPDIDNARGFMLQNLWYAQSLRRYGWIAGKAVVPVDNWWQNLQRNNYFTDGYRGIFWVSGQPLSLLDTEYANWDNLPRD